MLLNLLILINAVLIGVLPLFPKLLLMAVLFLEDLSLHQSGYLLLEFVVLSTNGIEHIVLLDQYLLIFFTSLEQRIILCLQLSVRVVFVYYLNL